MEAKKKQSQDQSQNNDRTIELEKKISELIEAGARAQAELQNAKIRMEKEAGDIRKFASESFLLRLLPTIDNFQRAFQHLPEELKDNEWVKGVSAIEKDFIRITQEVGLKKIESLGKSVDPQKHEVLMEGEGENGTIIQVFEDGYELNGKVIRPAKVKAGKTV